MFELKAISSASENLGQNTQPQWQENQKLDYSKMLPHELIEAFRNLFKEGRVYFVAKQVREIRTEFENKIRTISEETELLKMKNEFQNLYQLYKEEVKKYQEELELNLIRKEDIVNEIQKIVYESTSDNPNKNVREAHEKIKELREQWFLTGDVPIGSQKDLQERFKHYMNVFYDYLRLNRGFEETDLQHNLEEKQKILELAQALLYDVDQTIALNKFKRLQEDWRRVGPVKREYKEEINKQFREIADKFHQKKEEQNELFEENLKIKTEVIALIRKLNKKINENSSAQQWKESVVDFEKLTTLFEKVGKVPLPLREQIWKEYRKEVREFSKKRTNYYKDVRKNHRETLAKKKELLNIAKDALLSEDWENKAPLMRDIQKQWAEMEFVPKSEAKKIYKEFKDVCNEFFKKLSEVSKSYRESEFVLLKEKRKLLEEIKQYKDYSDTEKALDFLKNITQRWNEVDEKCKNIVNIDFNFVVALKKCYQNLGIETENIGMVRYQEYLQKLANDENLMVREEIFIRRKMEELRGKILIFENNLAFFADQSEKNPLVREVLKNIKNLKEALEDWKVKLEEIRSLRK